MYFFLLRLVLFSLIRKPCSGYKLKEMTGSKIFAADAEDGESESGTANPTSNNRTSVRIVQVYLLAPFLTIIVVTCMPGFFLLVSRKAQYGVLPQLVLRELM